MQKGWALHKHVWGGTASQNTKEWIQYVNHGQGKYCEPGPRWRWHEWATQWRRQLSIESGQILQSPDANFQEDEHTQGNQEEEFTDTETDHDDKYDTEGQFDDDGDYEGVVFVQNLLCKVQEKASIPASWIL